jgi:hypothetical protein
VKTSNPANSGGLRFPKPSTKVPNDEIELRVHKLARRRNDGDAHWRDVGGNK